MAAKEIDDATGQRAAFRSRKRKKDSEHEEIDVTHSTSLVPVSKKVGNSCYFILLSVIYEIGPLRSIECL